MYNIEVVVASILTKNIFGCDLSTNTAIYLKITQRLCKMAIIRKSQFFTEYYFERTCVNKILRLKYNCHKTVKRYFPISIQCFLSLQNEI